MLGFYYQRQSSEEALVSVSIVGAEVRAAYLGCSSCYPQSFEANIGVLRCNMSFC